MPQYLYPGVYVEERDTGNKPIEGVSTSTAGFLGIAERGPAVPTLLTSFGDYQRIFGAYVKESVSGVNVDRFLAYGVEGFFLNGGQTCYVQRLFHKDLTDAANSARPASATAGGKMVISAIGPGLWGNRIAYAISPAGLNDSTLFKLTLMYWSVPVISRTFTDGVTTSGSATLTSATANFSATSDVGLKIWGAGIPAKTTIKSVESATSVTLTQNATSTASGVAVTVAVQGAPADYSSPDVTEVFDNLSGVPAASTFYENQINGFSNLITVSQLAPGRPASTYPTTTTITVTATPASPASGQAVTLTATLAGQPAPTGTVTFLDATTVLGAMPIGDDGTASVTATWAAAGSHSITVSYKGDSYYLPVTSGAFSLTVTGSNTLTVTLTGTPSPSNSGQAVTFTATVTAAAGQPAPTGTVTFLDGTTVLGTGSVGSGGTATYTTSSLTAASHSITAQYGGDNNYAAATSAAFTQTVNAPPSGSPAPAPNPPAPAPSATPSVPQAILTLGGGTDGTIAAGASTLLVPADFQGDASDPQNKTGLEALADVDDVSILCCPDEFYLGAKSTVVAGLLVAQCEDLKYRFAILQSFQDAPQPPNHYPSQPSARGYAAYYYPWLYIVSPTTGTNLLIPPGGHVAGIYARSDSNRGVQKDPANEPILGIDHLQLQINNALQGQLNPLGVNCLRYFKTQGNLVWGGRTTSADPDWKYISVRRLFIFVEKSIQDGTQWVVFEPNDAPLWARVIRSVSDFLTGLWMNGMLQGSTKEQAYFVRCDRTTMTQADIDNGRLIMVIGIAPLKPAEFVIFRIGQWTGGSDVTEG
jgi:phage tail sheath protein FI